MSQPEPCNRADEVEFMERGLDWPYYRLPLKRYTADGFYEHGFLTLLGGPVVYGPATLFNVPSPIPSDLPRTVYPDFFAVYDDGWRVD